MKKSFLILVLVIASFFNLQSVFSQNFLAHSTDNYAGATGMFYQPASIADSRYKFDMEFIGFSSQIENNWFQIKNRVLLDANSWKDPDFVKNNLSSIKNSDSKYAFQSFEARILSFMVNINKKSAIGLSVRGRQIMNFDNLNHEAANLVLNANKNKALFMKPLDFKDMSQSAIAWAEYGLTYARVLIDDKEHFLKGGLTAKLLQGMGAMYLYEKKLGYTYVNQDSALNVDGDVKFGASSNFSDILKFKFGAQPTIGFDFGFVYEFRPNWKKYKYDMDGEENLWRKDLNKYMFRVSFSVLDLGSMKFKKEFNSRDFTINTNALNFQDLKVGSLDSLAKNTYDDRSNNQDYFNYRLPTTLNLNIDYQIIKGVFVNLGGRWALNQGTNHYSKAHYLNAVSLTPRWESKWFGVALPIRVNQFKKFNVGLGLRLGPLWVGSNNLIALTGLQKTITATDFYIALKIPIMYGAPQDADEDLVSDARDECKYDKGPLELNGCPDSDGDGIPNKDDDCAYTVGLAKFNGCPDTDGDGVQDKYDKCPDIAGLKEYQGCPDTDSDGVIDKNDTCPSVAGLEIFNGCPDTDGDSIPDNYDDCPNTPGLASMGGCPDTDKDGITDALDLCPEVFGLDSLKGCPYVDTDNDGIQDKYDQCPKVAGPASNNGCPFADSDNDSIPDKDDDCPMTPGPRSNNGCPVIKKEEQEILNTAFKNLEFKTGKDVIKSESFKSLNELAELMIKKPEFRLLIEGHTDNVGRDASNMRLSQKRAIAVQKYLSSKGVVVDRIDTKWYGETKPIADNKTKEGRARNRRVEMTVVFD